jgi:hypothetical protein
MRFCVAQRTGTLSKPGNSPYPLGMSRFFFIMMIIAMALTLLSLVVGLVGMVKGGEFNKKYGNRLMRARVTMQGIALAMFALAFLTSQSD